MNLRYHMHASRLFMGPEGDAAGGSGGSGGSAAPEAAKAPEASRAAPASPEAPSKATFGRKAPAKTPAPTPASAKKVAPEAPTRDSIREQQRLNDELRKTLEESRRMVESEQSRKRLALVREGMVAPLRDSDLEKIVPRIDPTTPAGEAALRRWKAERSDLYPPPVVAPRAKPEELGKKLPARLAKSVVFGPDSLRKAHEAMRVRSLD